MRKQPRAARIIYVAFLVFGALSVFYAVVSREVFGYYAAPLTYHVPLVLWNPALFRGGSRSAAVGSHPDPAPTVLDVLGIPAPSGWDGRSLFDPSRPPRAYFFAAAWGEYLLGLKRSAARS